MAEIQHHRQHVRVILAFVAGLVVAGGGGVAYAVAASSNTVDCDQPVSSTVGADGKFHIGLDCVGPAPAPTATPTTAPTTTPPATTPPPTTAPPTTPPPSSTFPGAGNTGVPPFAVLTPYTGPCTITAADTVIDAKVINCTLNIRTTGVVVQRSRVNGSVSDGSGDAGPGRSFAVVDSEITCAADTTCVGESRFTLTRVNAHGGNRMAHCYTTCTVQDSWLHGVRASTNSHASAMRAGQFTTVRHNTLACDVVNVTNGGCSADLTMYPDFEPIHDVLVEGNRFMPPGDAYYHAYGGWSPTKPYNSDPSNATNIVFRANVFERSWFNGPIAQFEAGRTGNVFSGNVWAPDGAVVTL